MGQPSALLQASDSLLTKPIALRVHRRVRTVLYNRLGSSSLQSTALHRPLINAQPPHNRHTSSCSSASIVYSCPASEPHSSQSLNQPVLQQQGQGQLQEPLSPKDVAIQALLHKCRTVFICMACCAAWGYLTSGLPSCAPFASTTLAVPHQHVGFEAAAKSAWAGLAAGVLHTLCGPDHLAALTPLTIGRNRVAASALGALWGFGHSTGQLLLGLVFVLLKDRFHDFLPALEKWSGTVVALTLVAIGLMGIYESYFAKEDDHHEEEQEAMKLALAGGPVSGGGGAISSAKVTSLKAGLATYVTGIVYGLQPDALFVVIPALALPTKIAAVAYCSMFVLGTVTAMGGYTLLIGTTSQALVKERPWLQSHLSTVASVFAIVVGVLIFLSGMGFEVPLIS